MIAPKEERLSFTEQAAELAAQMTLREKIALMTGCSDMELLRSGWRKTGNFSFYPYRAGGCDRLGVPQLVFSDGQKGAVCGFRETTCFPAPVCRGAGFDPALEQQIGAAIGRELRGFGVNTFGGVCVNLPYHPAWGRCQDVYSEDSFLIGRLGAALVQGVQRENVMACVKHFAFNSIENARLYVNVRCTPRTEREVFLPHFKACIDAGAVCVMGAFNRYDGEYCCENRHLLHDILKGEWGFDGIVMSDWFSGIHDTKKAVLSGLDLEMPQEAYYGEKLLCKVRRRQIPEAVINEAALRIIRTLLAVDAAQKSAPQQPADRKAHAALALRAAREGITLLKNEKAVLPFSRTATRKIAVFGALATAENLGDHSSSRVFPAHTVSLLDGISAMLPKAEIIYYSGENLAHAKRLAAASDAVIIAAGYTYQDEGEYMTPITSPEVDRCMGGDRKSLRLHESDAAFIREVGPCCRNTAVVLFGGGTIIPTEWMDAAPAILMAYYPGQEGGTALAEILFGKINPSGHLPFVVPYREEDLPPVDFTAEEVFYAYYHGYTRLEKNHTRPLYPFGFGLSYTSFQLEQPSFTAEDGMLCAACTVKNTGAVSGEAVVQLYVGFDRSAIDRPHRVLCGFARTALAAGEKRFIRLRCPLSQLQYYDEVSGTFRLEHMVHEVYLGFCCDDEALVHGEIML